VKAINIKYALPIFCVLLATMVSCTGIDLAPSRQAIDVQGLGHNPEWQLVIEPAGRQITFTLAGTEYRHQYPEQGPVLYKEDTRTTIYHASNDKQSMNIFVKGIECRDSKTGKAHEVTITVMLDAVGYKGCGDVLNR